MIGVLVGDQDTVEVVGFLAAQRLKPPEHFFFAESCINEESGVFGLKQRGVARTARS